MFIVSIALIYYSRTGVTRSVAVFVKERLASIGFRVDLYELKPLREYIKPLHFNPRLIIDTIVKSSVEYIGDEEFKPEFYDTIVIGTPIWYGQPTPIIKSFTMKWRSRIKAPVACYTTSTLNIKYSEKFRKYLETLGYNVILDFSVVKSLNKSLEIVEKALEEIVRTLHIRKTMRTT